ncbi:MAG: hypothetical protein Q7U89_00905 [Coriobacteriia bacterium]|nr:hypothetical protein [Coriobacteriia bacterium]
MLMRSQAVLATALTLMLALGIAGCAQDAAEPAQSPKPTVEKPAVRLEPLHDQQRYLDIVAAGIGLSYSLEPDTGTAVVEANVEYYGALRWTDDAGRSILVTHRYVANEPEQWVYIDEGVTETGVTENVPKPEIRAQWQALADAIVAATNAEPPATELYAWTSNSGVSTASYTSGGVIDDGNLVLNFGAGGKLGRASLAIPVP